MGLTSDRNDPDLNVIDETGMQKKYLVLSEEERRKGFVRPLRHSYKHVGVKRPNEANMRDLTDEEHDRYLDYAYVKFEEYVDRDPDDSVVGRFWTQKQLDELGGCGHITTMAAGLAETYARQPSFYGGTFCSTCRDHFPVGEFIWIDPVTGQDTDQRVGS